MKSYTAEELVENYNKFITLLETEFANKPTRLERLKLLYSEDHLGQALITSPASSRQLYHNSYPGGYLDHIMNVLELSFKLTALFKETGGIVDFTREEMVFSAIHHDLGKLGEPGNEYYIPEDSDWHREKLGQFYKNNPDLQHFMVPDRALQILNRYGIVMTTKEWLGIKLSDGLYDESNRQYLLVRSENKLKTNLPLIIHWADAMSATIEYNIDNPDIILKE